MINRSLLFALLLICSVKLSAQSKISLIPLPKKVVERKGSFTLNKNVYISYSSENL